jgi:hypothetical protein
MKDLAENPVKIYFFYVINFLASFLLFQIELIIAKILLPEFGGSYTVWGACIVFFQCAILIGYLYSHFAVGMMGIHKYRRFHLAMIFLPLIVFPGRPLALMKIGGGLPIVAEVFIQLLISIGIVFFVLSTISLITQTWLAASKLPQRKDPYWLYAFSNIGSFFALLSYPCLFEYNLDIPRQLMVWRCGYFILLLIYLTAYLAIGTGDSQRNKWKFSLAVFARQIQWDSLLLQKLRWILFSAASTIIFLSVTNLITSEIVPCPLIWIIPLSIYLLAFVLNFMKKPIYPRWIIGHHHLIIGFSAVLFFLTKMFFFPLTIKLMAHFLSLFALCMVCQRKLYKSRPKNNQGLTLFYVVISVGGFLGGLFVTWIAPILFSFPLEYLLGLWMVALGISLNFKKEVLGYYYLRLVIYLVLVILLWPLVFHQYNFFGLVILLGPFYFVLAELKTKPSAVTLAIGALLCIAPFTYYRWSSGVEYAEFRNYYGVSSLKIDNDALMLFSGITLHGIQMRDGHYRDMPTCYYYPDSPIGKLLSSPEFSFEHIGVVGLGVGTLASYGKAGQTMDFYELDPDIVQIADKYFSFLRDSRAQVNSITGDARINLSKSRARYDVMIIDAFSGDSVPVHLLTTEAVMEYRKHLTKNGVILFHISNSYLDLWPVISSNARFLGGHALLAWNEPKPNKIFKFSKWAAVTWDKNREGALISRLGWSEAEFKRTAKEFRPWTDNYSCILSILKTSVFGDSLKTFMPFYW